MKEILVPKIFKFLYEPHKIKVVYGGRGSGKSWAIAQYILIKCSRSKERVLCGRELQNSIKESVHQLLSDQIERLGLKEIYEITNTEIFCKLTGSEIRFKGLRYNIDEIKSMEGITTTWVEEAEKCSHDSWNKILPTIFRTDNAELLVSFNTGYEDDASYDRFVKSPPEKCVSVLVNYNENPYFPKELEDIRIDDLINRPLEYDNIWLGKPKGYGGKVWSQFINKPFPDGHIRTFDWKILEEKANVIMACDPAQKYYPACLWAAIFPFNMRMRYPEDFFIYIYNEYPDYTTFNDYFFKHRRTTMCNLSLLEQATIFFSKDSSGFNLTCRKRVIDTRFSLGVGGGNSWSSETAGLVELFAKPENGSIFFDLPSVKYIDSAKYEIIRDLSCNRNLPINMTNCPRLYVSPICKNLIYSLFNHRVEEASEKESEKLKDFSDCLRILYAGIKDFRYKDPTVKSVKDIDNTQKYFDKTNPSFDSWMC